MVLRPLIGAIALLAAMWPIFGLNVASAQGIVTPVPPPTVTPPPKPAGHPHHRHHFTIWHNSQEVVDRKAHPRHWHGFHVCSTSLAAPFPWCVSRGWKRYEKIAAGGYHFEWYVWPTPPKPAGHWIIASVSAYIDYGITASGEYVHIGGAGTCLPGAPEYIPFGTRVYVPGWGTVVINDDGPGGCYGAWGGYPRVELWMPPATYYQMLSVGFLGETDYDHTHRVFIYTR